MKERMSRSEFERRLAELSPAEQGMALLRLRDLIDALWLAMPKGEKQMRRAAMLGVRLTEFDPN